MAIFEKVSKYADADIAMPIRKTEGSAGYDMVAADTYIIPSLWTMIPEAKELWKVADDEYVTMELLEKFTKETGLRPTLVSTGMKCKLEPDTYLQLSVRSSSPLKYWLMLANGVGIIDEDYYNNTDNEGEIFFQIFNLAPFNIVIEKGTAIGQGIILSYHITEDDEAKGERHGGFGSTTVGYADESAMMPAT